MRTINVYKNEQTFLKYNFHCLISINCLDIKSRIVIIKL